MISIEMSSMSAYLKAREIMTFRGVQSFVEASQIAENSFTESSRHDYLEASKINELVNEDLDTSQWDRCLRTILSAVVLHGDYSWKGSFKFGRKYVAESLSVNERQVFRSAKLLDENLSDEIVCWWDQMQISIENTSSNMLFREWERRTFNREVQVLKEGGCTKSPRWESLDDNMSGYDILSFRKNNDNWEEVFIEVKSSSTELIRFFLSDREAEKLLAFPMRYFVYFWDTKNEMESIFTGEELIQHLPKNQGLGNWKSVLLNFS